MDLVEEDMHLALAYIDAATRGGARLTVMDLKAYLDRPERRRGGSYPTGLQTMVKSLLEIVSQMPTTSTPGETADEYLLRVRWVEVVDDVISLTPIGRAILSHAERPSTASVSDGPIVVQVDPTDPIAYLRVFDLIAQHGPGLLVDPWLDLERLSDLAQISDVDRVLTSDRTDRKRLDLMARVISEIPTIELRTAHAASLHDRFFFPDDGPVYMLGSSLNSISRRPGVLIPIADAEAASAMRKSYTRLWNSGIALPATGRTPGPDVSTTSEDD